MLQRAFFSFYMYFCVFFFFTPYLSLRLDSDLIHTTGYAFPNFIPIVPLMQAPTNQQSSVQVPAAHQVQIHQTSLSQKSPHLTQVTFTNVTL